MGNRGHHSQVRAELRGDKVKVPTPTMSYRRRAWAEFQRALDPLAPLKTLPPPRG
jgi:hypothetical protein